jgi:hypothetical protein
MPVRMRSMSRAWDEIHQAERDILEHLGQRVMPYSLSALINELEPRMDDAVLREAIWGLIGRRKVELTPDRKLRVLQDL